MPLRFLCFVCFACAALVDSQLVVSVGQRVEWMTMEGRPSLGRQSYGARRNLEGTSSSLAVDQLTGRLVAAPSGPELSSSGVLMSLGPKIPTGPLVASGPLTDSTRVAAIAVDPVSRHVYWTTGQNQTILRVSLEPPLLGASIHQAELVIRFQSEIPHGVAIDPCSGTLFWTNRELERPTVEKASLSEDPSRELTSRTVVASVDLFQPLGLAWSSGWLYWADERSGSRFRLERIRPDGSQRTLLVAGTHQQPFALVATSSFLFWTDVQQAALWNLPLDGVTVDFVTAGPVLVKKFPSTPTGLAATSLSKEELACPRVTPVIKQMMSEVDGKSECPPEYCLNGGICSTKQGTERSCSCRAGFVGSRCQYENRLCAAFCLDHASTVSSPLYAVCRCSEVPIPPPATVLDSSADEKKEVLLWRTVSFVLGGVTFVAIAVVIVMTIISCRLSRRPRLRRRYTVTKKKMPTVSKTAAVSNSQCEIDIENCCNMNICETPCFEPELRKGDCGTFSRDEKRGLINSEEPTANTLPPSAKMDF